MLKLKKKIFNESVIGGAKKVLQWLGCGWSRIEMLKV